MVRGTMCWYQSHISTYYFTAWRIIIKHSFIRVCKIYNEQRQELTNFKEQDLPNDHSVACHLLTLY